MILADTHWANGLTAGGTIAVAVVAVGVALWSEWRLDRRTREERRLADDRLRQEREAADKRLADQMAHSDAQLAQEREAADARLRAELEHSDKRLMEERHAAQEAEQLAEASSVEVMAGRLPAGEHVVSTMDDPAERPAVIVVNGGRHTISRVDARFSPDGQSIISRDQAQTFTDFDQLPFNLGHDVTGVIGDAYVGVLMPGRAIRFIGGAMLVRYLRSTYPIVRWTDRWGTRWENKHGDVHQVTEDAEWRP